MYLEIVSAEGVCNGGYVEGFRVVGWILFQKLCRDVKATNSKRRKFKGGRLKVSPSGFSINSDDFPKFFVMEPSRTMEYQVGPCMSMVR